jgi:Mrp family chromosome partitioning ATPase
MSVFLGLMLAFTFEYMDQTFKSPGEIESYLNLPYLGSIPPRPNAKSFDVIDEQLMLLAKDKGVKALMFTTPTFERESQNVVLKIARSISAKETLKILVIDANFRKTPYKKSHNKAGNVETKAGLVDLIEGKITFDQSIKTVSDNLYLLAPGKTELNPVTIIDSNKMEAIFKEAINKFDLVLVETPDLTKKESLLMTNHVDGVILIVNENKTRKQVAKAMLDPLKKKNTRILGVILNNRRFTIPRIIYERV